MSEQSDNKRENFNIALKIGAVVGGIYFLNRIDKYFFAPSGRVDRVSFDWNNTQVRKVWIGGETGFKIIADPWSPNTLADELFEVMSGIAGEFGDTPSGYGSDLPREVAWSKVEQLGFDRARALHNYWLEKIDPEETLYRWIKGEIPAPFSSEDYQKERTLNNLMSWGIGF